MPTETFCVSIRLPMAIDHFVTLTDDELGSKLQNTEDPYVERKTGGDDKDILKTVVAMANSLAVGLPGVLFIPVTDAGAIQTGVNLDMLQRKISTRIALAYPPIRYFQRVLAIESAEVIAVQVWGSPDRPHFAGSSYVRDGSQTLRASDQQFDLLIARRSSKVEALSQWIEKRITVDFITAGAGPRVEQTLEAIIEGCTQWYVTLKFSDPRPHGVARTSIILERVRISFDHVHDRLLIEVHR